MNKISYPLKAEKETDLYFTNYFSSNIKRVGTQMIYEDEEIIEYLYYNFTLTNEGYEGGIFAERKLKKMEILWEDFRNDLGFRQKYPSTINAEPRNEKNNLITCFKIPYGQECNDDNIVRKSRAYIYNFYKKVLFPILEKKSNIKFLNSIHNNPSDKEFPNKTFHKMIVAKLSGNKEYDFIRNNLRLKYEGLALGGDKVEKWKKYIEKIDELDRRLEKVEILSNPYLGSSSHPFLEKMPH